MVNFKGNEISQGSGSSLETPRSRITVVAM